MMNCPDPSVLSKAHAGKRQAAAEQQLGKATLAKYLAHALFLFGAKLQCRWSPDWQ